MAGGAVALLLGIAAIGAGALLGRIPLFLGLLLGLAASVTLFGLFVTIATLRKESS